MSIQMDRINPKGVNGVIEATQLPGADIGAKINAAIALLGGAGAVRVAAGSYSFSTTIQYQNGIELIGAGPFATILNYTGAGVAVNMSAVTGAVFSGIGLTLNNVLATGIQLAGVQNRVENFHISGLSAKSLWITGYGGVNQTVRTFVRNGYIEQFTNHGVHVDHAADIFLTDIWSFAVPLNATAIPLYIGTGVSGIYVVNMVTGWGLHSLAVHNDAPGAGAYGQSPIYGFFSNFLGDTTPGGDTYLFSSDLSNNTLSFHFTNSWAASAGADGFGGVATAASHGIHISGGNDITFEGGRILAASGNGVLIDNTNVSQIKINGNDIFANNYDNNADQHGIYITAAAADVQITANRIGNVSLGGGHQRYGIKVSANAPNLLITSNNLANNNLDGLNSTAANANSMFWGNYPATVTSNVANTLNQFINGVDSTNTIRFGAGSTTEQTAQVIFQGKTADIWNLFKGSDNSLQLRDIANSRTLLVAAPGASSSMGFPSGLFLSAAAPTVSAGQIGLGSTHATTVGAAGGATALPATPLGYIIANVDGTAVKIPYYNN